MGAARNEIEPLMTRLLQAVGFLMLAARSGALFAIFGPPELSPAAPTSADVISMVTRASGCYLFYGGPNDAVVTTAGTTITIVVPARINAFCNFPTTTNSYVVGRFPPGVYTLKAFYLPHPLSGGGPPRLMGQRPVTVAPYGDASAVPIPSLTALAAALLAALCVVVAAVERRKRRSRTAGALGPPVAINHPET